jgi:agmatinase
VVPAVSGLSPGGLSYWQASDLLQATARRCRVAGAAFTELVPALDHDGASALVAARLLTQLLGSLARSIGQT